MKKSTQKQKYLWERKTDTSLQFWPNDSKEFSLIKPTVPQKYIGKGKGAKITSPKSLAFDALGARGIRHSAITEHASGFYTQRAKENFNFVSFTTGGSATLKIDNKTFKLSKGTLFYASSKSEYILSVSKKWNMVFFHLPAKLSVCDCRYAVENSSRTDEVAFLAQKYLEEISSPTPAYSHLEHLADLLVYCVNSEVGKLGKKKESLSQQILEIPTSKLIFKSANQYCPTSNAIRTSIPL